MKSVIRAVPMIRILQRGIVGVQSALFVYLAIDRAVLQANVGTSFRAVAIASNAVLALGLALLAFANQRSRAWTLSAAILEVVVLAWVGGNLGTVTLIQFVLGLAMLLLVVVFRSLQSRRQRAEA
jgi:hypothetical protein